MLVEILPVERPNNCIGTVRVIAIQYASSDSKMELMMRKADAVFDIVYPDMSDEMKRRVNSRLYRTAILRLA